MKSSWEVATAKYLDMFTMIWTYEPTSFPTPYGYYTPDFYLPELDLYIEVKGQWRDDAKQKFDFFSKNENILLFDQKWLVKQGFRLQKDGTMKPPIKIKHLRMVVSK